MYIHIHAASISCTARCIQRGRVDAEHGYRITHNEYAPLLRLLLTFITDAWPASLACYLRYLLQIQHGCLLSSLYLNNLVRRKILLFQYEDFLLRVRKSWIALNMRCISIPCPCDTSSTQSMRCWIAIPNSPRRAPAQLSRLSHMHCMPYPHMPSI